MVLLITCLIVYNLIVILYDLLRYVILLYRRYLYKHKPKPQKSEVIENEDPNLLIQRRDGNTHAAT